MKHSAITTGLYLLATAATRSPGNWFAGHGGAAILAAHFLVEEHDFETSVGLLVQRQMAFSLERETLNDAALGSWVEVSRAADRLDAENNIKHLALDVKRNCELLSTAGHGVIYGSFALKALQQAPELASKATVEGIIELLKSCRTDRPGRYYGCRDCVNGEFDLGAYDVLDSIESVIEQNLREHSSVFADQDYQGIYYYFAGNALHSLTYSDALLTLNRLGYNDLCEAGLTALKKHIVLSQRRPAELLPRPHSRFINPMSAAYWAHTQSDPHHLKLAYSLLNLLSVPSAVQQRLIESTMAAY